MKTHLTSSDILDLAFERFNIANPNVDKIVELADSMGLEYDEDKDAYYNPDCCACGKVLDKFDLEHSKKSHPLLCVGCFTSNA